MIFQDKCKLIDILKKGSDETWVTFKKIHDYGKEENIIIKPTFDESAFPNQPANSNRYYDQNVKR